MLVNETMGGPVDTCTADATLAQAARRMTDEGHGALPVTSHGRLVGIITERDVLRAVADRRSPDKTKVSQLMTPDPDSLEPDVDVVDAADWMLAAGYRHLPVVSAGQVVGMVSIKDILWALTGETNGLRGRFDNGDRP